MDTSSLNDGGKSSSSALCWTMRSRQVGMWNSGDELNPSHSISISLIDQRPVKEARNSFLMLEGLMVTAGEFSSRVENTSGCDRTKRFIMQQPRDKTNSYYKAAAAATRYCSCHSWTLHVALPLSPWKGEDIFSLPLCLSLFHRHFIIRKECIKVDLEGWKLGLCNQKQMLIRRKTSCFTDTTLMWE